MLLEAGKHYFNVRNIDPVSNTKLIQIFLTLGLFYTQRIWPFEPF